MITRAQRFVEQVYWPDLLAIAGFYKDWAAIGGGVPNFLSYGEFPEGDVRDLDKLTSPAASSSTSDLSKVHPFDQTKVKEYITSSWYEYSGRRRRGAPPLRGRDQGRSTPARRRRGLPAGR